MNGELCLSGLGVKCDVLLLGLLTPEHGFVDLVL